MCDIKALSNGNTVFLIVGKRFIHSCNDTMSQAFILYIFVSSYSIVLLVLEFGEP